MTSVELQIIWRNIPNPITTPIQTPASNKKYPGPNPYRNHLARIVKWIKTSEPIIPALITGLVDIFGNIPTIVKSKMMNSDRVPMVPS